MAIPDRAENRARCICARCPSHIGEDKTLFCAVGKSNLAVAEKGCLCRTCPVHIEYTPRGRFYCIRGAAR